MAKLINHPTPKRERVAHLPAGQYYVGDPCYTVPDHEWMEYLEVPTMTGKTYDVDGRTVQLDSGRIVAAHGTAFGDGVYNDEDGFAYGVDAGLIGVVAVQDRDKYDANLQRVVDRKLVQVVTFDEDFTLSYDDGAIIMAPWKKRRLVIDTDRVVWDSEDEGSDDETSDLAQAVLDCASDEGLDADTTYSGRGMFGAVCLSVSGSQWELTNLWSQLGEEVRAELGQPRSDSMGLGQVWYWPGIS